MTIKTISQLEAGGYTHIECWCEACRMTVQVPFTMIRKSRPMLSAMDFDELGAKMRCRRCGAAPARFKPYRQSDEPGFTTGFPRPGQSREPWLGAPASLSRVCFGNARKRPRAG